MPNSLIRYNYGGVRWWSNKIIKFLWSNLGLGGFSKSIVSVVLVSVDLNSACGPPNVIYFLKAIAKTCPHDPKMPIQLVPNPFNPSILIKASLHFLRWVLATVWEATITRGATPASPSTSLEATSSSLRMGRCTLREVGWRISRRLMMPSQSRSTLSQLGQYKHEFSHNV